MAMDDGGRQGTSDSGSLMTDGLTGEGPRHRDAGGDFVRDGLLDVPEGGRDNVDGGAHSGAVGGEKGAVAVTMAGETTRGYVAQDSYVEPNSPDAIAEEYEG